MNKQSNIKQHEDKYWHIPKLALLPLLGFIVFTLLAYGNYLLIDKQVIATAFNCEKDNCNLTAHNLINIYPIIAEYLLISLAIISLVAVFKKGYKNLKSYNKEGLIGGLIVGLIGGLIAGLIFGLIVGLIGGLIAGLIVGLIAGLIFGLIFGLIAGLIAGLIGGLSEEFT